MESATRSTGGRLDWWVKERQEWWDRVAVKTVVNDAIRGNACHTWNAEEDIAEPGSTSNSRRPETETGIETGRLDV